MKSGSHNQGFWKSGPTTFISRVLKYAGFELTVESLM